MNKKVKLTIILQVIDRESKKPLLEEVEKEFTCDSHDWEEYIELQERAKYAEELRKKSKYVKSLRDLLGSNWVVDSISVIG